MSHQRPRSPGDARGDLPDAASRALRVLIAEDARSSSDLLARVLSRRGHLVQVAHDGREAVACCEAQAFDVILMDIEMPILDGLEATGAIRALESRLGRPRTPIVALTAHARDGDRERLLAAGLDAYLVKPVNLDLLVEVVESPHAAPASGSAGPPAAALAAGAGAVFDGMVALSRLNGDIGLLREMAAFFREDAPQVLAELHAALGRGELSAAQRAAHTLSGMAAMFEARPAVAAAARVESLARAASVAELPASVARLEEEVGRLARALASEYRLDPAPPTAP